MYYVYMISSCGDPERKYIGFSSDLRTRLRDHNEGRNVSTRPYKPWKLDTYIAFSTKIQALEFERYLKSGSGHAFAKKRLWP